MLTISICGCILRVVNISAQLTLIGEFDKITDIDVSSYGITGLNNLLAVVTGTKSATGYHGTGDGDNVSITTSFTPPSLAYTNEESEIIKLTPGKLHLKDTMGYGSTWNQRVNSIAYVKTQLYYIGSVE